jgi:hypothetical protein
MVYSPERRDTVALTCRIFVARVDKALITSAVDTRPTRYNPAIIQSCSAIIASPVKCLVLADNAPHLVKLLLAITAMPRKA